MDWGGSPIPITPQTEEIINRHTPYQPENENKQIAKIIVEMNEVNIITLQIKLHLKYKKITVILTELERLGIISSYSYGRYNILVTLEQIDKIFDTDPKYRNAQQSLLSVL